MPDDQPARRGPSHEQMMFVRQAATHFMPHLAWDVDKSIRYAEQLYARLAQRGYTARTGQTKPRASRDWYAELGVQREAFDRFWAAFAHRRARGEAAMTWLKIDPDAATAERIVVAARQEAQDRRLLPVGSVPIMAQGWLTQRRWEDHEATPDNDAERRARAAARHELRGELASLKRLRDAARDESTCTSLDAQIAAIEARLG